MLKGIIRKRLLLLLLLTVLMDPGGEQTFAPENTQSRRKRRRKVAECKKCSFVATSSDDLVNHQCPNSKTPDKSACNLGNEMNKPTTSSKRARIDQDRNRLSECPLCASIVRLSALEKHKNSRFCKISCNICLIKVNPDEYNDHLKSHEMNLNTEFSSGAQSKSRSKTFSQLTEHYMDECFREIALRFQKHIKSYVKIGRIMQVFNFQSDGFSASFLSSKFRGVFRNQRNSFKINISIGYILENRETGELNYMWSNQNNQLLFDNPKIIRNIQDREELCEKIGGTDFIEKLSRPSTKWAVVQITNVTFYVYRLDGRPIGSPTTLPTHLSKNQGLHGLITRQRDGKRYEDNKCFFRCLALHLGCTITNLETKTKKLLKEYCLKVSITSFEGVSLDQLEVVSRIFGVGINVYQQSEDKKTELIFRSTLQDNILYLNLYQDHFSFIKDMSLYSRTYYCSKCNKIWNTHWELKRHMGTCDTGVKKKYHHKVFTLKQTVFEELADNGVIIPENMRHFPFQATFDIECYLNNDADLPTAAKMEYTAEHRLASISVCSNTPGYTNPKCFVSEGNERKIVEKFIDYLMQISETSAAILRDKYQIYIDQIKDEALKEKFLEYLSELPVLSFNGSKYDLRILKIHLIPILIDLGERPFVIKKGTAYMCIKTETLKFLDVISYIAPNFSYSEFLAAYGVKENKGYFPYSWFTNLGKLETTKFPCYEEFYSTLKDCNTLEPRELEKLSGEEIGVVGRTPDKDGPLTPAECLKVGSARYHKIRTMFYDKKWSMKDYLIYYNNLDVGPFLTALRNLTKYYSSRGVDVFKDGISAPGISERLAFKDLKPDEVFYTFNKKNSDLIDLFHDNNVGGPAIIFDRYQEAGVTRIRHDPKGKLTQKVIGLDANALYLGCLAENMPSGIYIRRRYDHGFVKEYPTPISYSCGQWLAYIEDSGAIHIQHARNGAEYRAGQKKIPVDGHCKATNVIYQFHGCFWHGCTDCYKDKRDEQNGKWASPNDRKKRTEDMTEYLISEGYSVAVIWECEWRELRKTVTHSNKYNYPTESRYRLTESEILRNIEDDKLFGAIEVDLNVPDHLKDYFSEMTPIFKNTIVREEDIGIHMTDYLKKAGASFKDQKYLIGSMHAKNILLITPLLRWYLEHGLKVTRIHQVIEFNPKKCFKPFAEKVSNDRRAGDSDDSKKMVAETSKLVGNSVYGHTLMDKSKHTSVKFCSGDEASKLINDPFFRQIDEFDDETFEVTSTKKRISYDLPVQIGFFTYSYAKLKMLEFYFDVLDKFVSREDFVLLEMDTDSLYLGISGQSLDDIVKVGMKDEWAENKYKWFPRIDTPEHARYDKRTPGLFKTEWEGDGFIGLSAKTYYCFSTDPKKKDKYSSKGVSRSLRLTKCDYMSVIKSTKTKSHLNKGFILKNNRMFSYELEKSGLSYLYAKRKVLRDGLSTTFLDI